jgi:hypothetical protein
MSLPDPVLRFAFEARVAVGPSERIGDGAGGELWFTPITGGSVEGPRLRGAVVPGGGDRWARRGQVIELDATYLLRAEDGALIDIVNRGFWRASPEVEARLDAGEPVPESAYYYRTQPVFRTDAPPHRWLAETVFVGLAREEEGHVCIRFFALD